MEEVKRGRGRPPKSEVVQKERRRRSGSTGKLGLKLGLPEWAENDKVFTYRWVNDTRERIHNLTTNDDWDLVKPDGSAVASNPKDAMKRPVGKDESGLLYAYLMRKPTEYVLEDRAEAQRRIDEKMKKIQGGAKGADSEHLQTHGYNPTRDTIKVE